MTSAHEHELHEAQRVNAEREDARKCIEILNDVALDIRDVAFIRGVRRRLGSGVDASDRAYLHHLTLKHCGPSLAMAQAEPVTQGLVDAPEPSDFEQSTWPTATRHYVNALEAALDRLIDERSDQSEAA